MVSAAGAGRRMRGDVCVCIYVLEPSSWSRARVTARRARDESGARRAVPHAEIDGVTTMSLAVRCGPGGTGGARARRASLAFLAHVFLWRGRVGRGSTYMYYFEELSSVVNFTPTNHRDRARSGLGPSRGAQDMAHAPPQDIQVTARTSAPLKHRVTRLSRRLRPPRGARRLRSHVCRAAHPLTVRPPGLPRQRGWPRSCPRASAGPRCPTTAAPRRGQ